MCTLQRHCGSHKADQTNAAHYVLSHCNENDLFLQAVVYKLAQVPDLLAMTKHRFLL